MDKPNLKYNATNKTGLFLNFQQYKEVLWYNK